MGKALCVAIGLMLGVAGTLLAGWLYERREPELIIRIPGRAPNYVETWS